MTTVGKIKTLRELERIVLRRRRRERIVTVNGSYDLIHAGHVRGLCEAKAQGDVLVVLVNSDSSVRAYKGPGRPIVPELERAALLAALEPVDYVAIFDDLTPVRVLALLKPHVHANGADWSKNCVEREVVERNGGRIHVLRFHPGVSTTNVLNRIKNTDRIPAVRAVFLDRDGTVNHDGERYTHRREDFRFLPGAISALRALSRTDFKLIIVTNQSGIGRGYYKEQDMKRLHRWMVKHLKAQGVRIDAIYHCPHRPGDGCACRKPGTGMLLKAVRDFGVSLAKSWIVGDAEIDVLAGRMANVKAIKVGGRLPRDSKITPHFYARDLREASKIILREV